MLAQTESHADGSTSDERHTVMRYLGLSSLVSAEDHFEGDSDAGTALTAKSYSYDAWGHRISLTNDETQAGSGGSTDPEAETFTYAYDVHGSVSLLINDSSTATASYGYRPYGGANDALTAGDFDPSNPDEDPDREDNPLNAFRYSGRRLDTGSGSIDMGARRYGPDTGRFLQRDFLSSALGDLGLSLDPLTQGRYNFAGGNPISFVEWDGHVFYVNGDGGGVEMPNRDSGGEEPIDYWQYFLNQLNPLEASSSDYGASGAAGAQTALDITGQRIIIAGQERAAGYRALADSARHWWERAGYHLRAFGTETLSTLGGGVVKVAGGVIGLAGVGLTAADAAADQAREDALRNDLSDTERTFRSGISAITTTMLSVAGGTLGAIGFGVLSGGNPIVAGAGAAGGAYVGSAAGATAGEFIVK